MSCVMHSKGCCVLYIVMAVVSCVMYIVKGIVHCGLCLLCIVKALCVVTVKGVVGCLQ